MTRFLLAVILGFIRASVVHGQGLLTHIFHARGSSIPEARSAQVRSDSVLKHTPVRPGLVRRQLQDSSDDEIIDTSDELREYSSQAEDIWQDDDVFYDTDARNGSNLTGSNLTGIDEPMPKPVTTTTSTTVSWTRKNTSNASLGITMIAGRMELYCEGGMQFETNAEAQSAFTCALSVLAEVKCTQVSARFSANLIEDGEPDQVIVDWAIDEDSNNATETIERMTKTTPDEVEDIMGSFFEYFADGEMHLEPDITSLRVDGFGEWHKRRTVSLREALAVEAAKTKEMGPHGTLLASSKGRGPDMSGPGGGNEPATSAMPSLA
mmetsp:Transcript_57612/g.100808  ORF Transcript_57612/g.100808 Transcript_57612/m.100808 type:complete len:322 (+) Transcript_57612:146-1111(+)